MNEMGRGVRVGVSELPPGLLNVESSYFLDGKIPKNELLLCLKVHKLWL